jgi:putative FmdB family regulatory protein
LTRDAILTTERGRGPEGRNAPVTTPERVAPGSTRAGLRRVTLEPGRCGMPTYVFKCSACGDQFEKVMSISEREKGKPPSCPKCKKHKVERVYTSFYAKTGRKS